MKSIAEVIGLLLYIVLMLPYYHWWQRLGRERWWNDIIRGNLKGIIHGWILSGLPLGLVLSILLYLFGVASWGAAVVVFLALHIEQKLIFLLLDSGGEGAWLSPYSEWSQLRSDPDHT